jgi:hypothetical protein
MAMAVLFLATLLSQSHVAMAQSNQRIQLTQLQAMFADMRAKAPWNVDGPLLWGYYFLDSKPSKLHQAASELLPTGYNLVAIQEIPGKGVFRLHIEKVEIHTPETLHKRNGEFYALAEKHGIASYDGMDVGPAPK